MGCIGRLLGYILLGINMFVALLLLFSAYSPNFNPHVHPMWSCSGLLFPVFLLFNVLFLIFWLFVYRRYVLLPLLTFVLCWGSIRTYCPINLFGEEAPEEAIKILSYNTRAFGMKAAHTKAKSNNVLAYLQECDADIICLQEYIWGGKLKKKDVDYALRDYRYKHYQAIGKGNGLGVYSRYPILSSTPIKYKSKGYGSVAYRIKVGNDTLLVINNHLESNKILKSDVIIYEDMLDDPSKETLLGTQKLQNKLAKATTIRANQADALLQEVKNAKEKNIVVCGDFNDTPISYTHQVLADELVDAFVESGNGLGISFNQNRMYVRIDHILTSKNLKTYDCKVDRSVEASDHYPISCYISFPKDEE